MKEKQHLERKDLFGYFLTARKLNGVNKYHELLLCCSKMMLGEHFQKWVLDHNCLTVESKMHVEWYKIHREVTDL